MLLRLHVSALFCILRAAFAGECCCAACGDDDGDEQPDAASCRFGMLASGYCESVCVCGSNRVAAVASTLREIAALRFACF